MMRAFHIFTAFIAIAALDISGVLAASDRGTQQDRSRERGDRYDNYRSDPEWHKERERRRLQRRLEREEERRLYREWLEASSVTCFHGNTIILSVDMAKTVVPETSGPWSKITFFDASTKRLRILNLFSPAVSCAYVHHDPAYTAAQGTIQGGLRRPRGASQLLGTHIMTCHDGARTRQGVLTNISVTWKDRHLQVSSAQTRPITLDTHETACFTEQS